MTVVDQTRLLAKLVQIPACREHISRDFSGNSLHRFMQELRVDVIHVSLHAPGWQLVGGTDEDRSTKFVLHAKTVTSRRELQCRS